MYVYNAKHYFSFLIVMLAATCHAFAQETVVLPPTELKKLSLEELMDIEVTSVSKSAEKLSEVASAIQVITNEDIKRSGATNIPEALRLATNLQVAQLNSYGTIVSARGFNGLYANKLLVLIDGRVVYSPLFAGVLWDAQNIVLEDIDRIEVISGPGGTLWGANAVNGVINIITKSASETPGIHASAAVGTFLKNYGNLRYGGKIGKTAHYRIYGQHFTRNKTFMPDTHEDNTDDWGLNQTGFRVDWSPSTKDALTFEGELYAGKEHTAPADSKFNGQNILGRWRHNISPRSQIGVQMYFDRTWRKDIPSTLTPKLKTYDFDFQYRLPFGKKHNVLWGVGYRYISDYTANSTKLVGFIPQKKNLYLFSGFVQDEIRLKPDLLKLTIGSKLLHNTYSGFEIQPSLRIAATPNERNTVWASVSRAVRTPSRIDVDYFIPTTPVPDDQAHVAGGPDFVSEKVIAYELGYRTRPLDNLFISLAAFYNSYDDLYSVEAVQGTQIYQIQNGTEGRSWGVELSGNYQITSYWRLRGGYTYFNKDLDNKPGRTFDFSTLGYDANSLALLQSMLNLPQNFRVDIVARYMGKLQEKEPEYFTFDARLAWEYHEWEIELVGQNLWKDRHREWAMEIPRGVYAQLSWRFSK